MKTNLTEEQEKEAIALYLHLLNHPEVQDAPVNPGMPMCKICGKTSKQIVEEKKILSDSIISPSDEQEYIRVPAIKEKLKEFIGWMNSSSDYEVITEYQKKANEIFGDKLIGGSGVSPQK